MDVPHFAAVVWEWIVTTNLAVGPGASMCSISPRQPIPGCRAEGEYQVAGL